MRVCAFIDDRDTLSCLGQFVTAALTLVRSLKGRVLAIRTIHKSGTIRACQAAAIRFNQEVCHGCIYLGVLWVGGPVG